MNRNVLNYLEVASVNFPENVFLEQDENSMTYEFFSKSSYVISNELISNDGNKNKPVVIFLEKNIHAYQAIVATLMSGNIYCPIDVNSPVERLIKIVKSLGDCQIITCNKWFDKASSVNEQFGCKLINIESIISDVSNVPDNFWDKVALQIDDILDIDPCYIIFTSGSTGTPKGVVISHLNVMDYIDWANETFDISESDRFGSQAPLYFDNSTLDLYLSVSNGSCLNLIPDSVFIFPKQIISYLNEQKITTIFWVPSILVNIANFNLLESNELQSLKNILFAGEVMPAKQIKYWLKHHKNAMYVNLYGPTEITVDCTYYIVPPAWDGDDLPIGIPCSNTEILILDEQNNKSTFGELCVKGSCLALGYWADFYKTSKVFIQNPLNDKYIDLIYKTGDIVEFKNQLIYYKGRKDHQIKHNGYRIELGEIESAALNIDEVMQAVAQYDDVNKKIFLVAVLNSSDVSKVVLSKLKSMIPKYMFPHKLYVTESMPLTANGKIDRLVIKDKFGN